MKRCIFVTMTFALAAVAAVACVPRGRYDQAVAAATQAQAEADRRQRAAEAEIARLNGALRGVEAESQDRAVEIADLSARAHNAQAELDEAMAIGQQLRAELARLGQNADELVQEKGALSHALDDANSRLEELRKGKALSGAGAAPEQHGESR